MAESVPHKETPDRSRPDALALFLRDHELGGAGHAVLIVTTAVHKAVSIAAQPPTRTPDAGSA